VGLLFLTSSSTCTTAARSAHSLLAVSLVDAPYPPCGDTISIMSLGQDFVRERICVASRAQMMHYNEALETPLPYQIKSVMGTEWQGKGIERLTQSVVREHEQC